MNPTLRLFYGVCIIANNWYVIANEVKQSDTKFAYVIASERRERSNLTRSVILNAVKDLMGLLRRSPLATSSQ